MHVEVILEIAGATLLHHCVESIQVLTVREWALLELPHEVVVAVRDQLLDHVVVVVNL